MKTFKLFKLIGGLFILLVATFSQQNIGGSGLLMPNNTALWFLVGLLVILGLYSIYQKSKIALSSFANYFILILAVIVVFSFIKTEATIEQRFMFGVSFLGIILYFYSLYQWKVSHSFFLKILLFLSLVGLSHALVSVIQIQDPYHVWYVLTGYLPFNLAGARPIGIVQQVNMNATLLATVLVINLYLMTHRSFQTYKWYWQILVISSTTASLYILMLSGSRAGFLALIVGLILVLAARFKGIKKNKIAFVLWLFSAFVAIILALNFPGSTNNTDLLGSKLNQVIMGTDVRLFLYGSGWTLFWQSPWFGYGLGGYTQALMHYVEQFGMPPQIQGMKLVEFLHPHNEILYWMLQSGVVALVGIMALVTLYLKILFRQRVRFAIGVLGLAMPMLIQAQLSSPFIFSSIHLLLPLFFLHYGIRNDKKIYCFKLGLITKRVIELCLLLILVVLSYVTWFTLMSIKDAHDYEYRLFLTAQQTPDEIANMRYFEYATHHPSFSVTVHKVMNKMILQAIEDSNRYDAQRFIWWAENQPVADRSQETKNNLNKAYSLMSY